MGPGLARATTIELKDGRKYQGDVLNFGEGKFEIRTDAGERITLGAGEVKSIGEDAPEDPAISAETDNAPKSAESKNKRDDATVKDSEKTDAPVPTLEATSDDFPIIKDESYYEEQAPFSSPQKTFYQWKDAAMAGDRKAMLACYAGFRQDAVKKELRRLKRKKWNEMKEATARSQFFLNDPLYQGNRAMMEIIWRVDLLSKTQILNFILENGKWKLVQ